MTDTTGLRPPSGGDANAMRLWGMELVTRLRQGLVTLEQESSDSAGVALDEIVEAIDTLTNFGDLTDVEKASLGLSDAVNDQLALSSDVLTEIAPFVDTPGRAAVYAYLRAHQNDAAVRVEQSVRQSETLSLSTQVTSLTADLAETDAAVIAEQTARATGDTALASDIATVSTTVAGHTTSITQHQASIDGIEAEWGVTINAQGQVVGLIRLDAGATGSAFTVVVDKFQVAKTDGSGVVPIFQVGTVDGVSRVALAADMLVDGYIAAQHLAAGSVSTEALEAAAVTADKVAANAITAAAIDVASLSAIAADVGTVTAGRIESADGTSFWDLDNNIFQIGTA